MSLFAVVRHEERADALDAAFVQGKHWCKTEDFTRWPSDPPLSDKGLELAEVLGHRLQALVKERGSDVHIVLSSPYHRCIQTATAICQLLGNHVPLLVDFSLGEVFGPCVLGDSEPKFPYVRFRDSQPRNVKTAGSWPAWPEKLEEARLRLGNRIVRYIRRSSSKNRNFIVVTHGDGVAAALSAMPSITGNIRFIETGGFFFATRQGYPAQPLGAERKYSGDSDDEAPDSPQVLPKESDGWHVHLHGISLSNKSSIELTTKRTLKSGIDCLPLSPFEVPPQESSAATWSFLLQSDVSGIISERGVSDTSILQEISKHSHTKCMLRHVDELNRVMKSQVDHSDDEAKIVELSTDLDSGSNAASFFSVSSSSLLQRRNRAKEKQNGTEEIVVRV